MICNGGENNGVVQAYCCTDGIFDCCAIKSSLSSIPVFSTVFRPGERDGLPTFTTASPSTIQSTTSATQTSTSSPLFSASASVSPTPTPTPFPFPQKTNTTLAVGLGLGIPFSLILVASLSYIAWQRRKASKAIGISGLANAPQEITTDESGTDTWKAIPLEGRTEMDVGHDQSIAEMPAGWMGSHRR